MEYGLDEKRVKIQIDYLKEIIKGIPVTDFYSSEPYGKFVAKYMNVNDDRVDSKRVEVPICATNIRKDISRYKEFLDKRVYDDYKNICSKIFEINIGDKMLIIIFLIK